jgi:predicted transcriptional regulator
VVFPVEDSEHIGCFTNQMKLTYALVRDLDEAMKEIQQLGNHVEEASWKISELEALCKQKEDAAKKLTEEKAKLEGMVQSCDELIMEMTGEYGLN